MARALVNPPAVRTLALSGHTEAGEAVAEVLITFALCYVVLVLHRPTVRAKEFSAGPDGPTYLEALRQLFDLPTVPAPGPGALRARLSITARRP